MLVLIIYQTNNTINYHIYQLFNKKHSLQRYGKIQINSSDLIWEKYNAQTKLVNQTKIEIHPNELAYDKIVNHTFFNKYQYDIIVHKVACGGDEFQQICRLTPQNLKKLSQMIPLAPNEQAADIALSSALLEHFPQTKHYVSFDSGFHSTIELKNRMLTLNWELLNRGIKNYGTHGLAFASIASRLINLSEKKIAKGRWVIIYVDNHETTLCAIKNAKSVYCSSSGLHHEFPSPDHLGLLEVNLPLTLSQCLHKDPQETTSLLTQNQLLHIENCDFASLDELLQSHIPAAKLSADFYTSTIANGISKLATELGGLDGVIFSGKLGISNPRLRQLVANKLSWLGLEVVNKANLENQCKLHKKNSNIKMFALAEKPEEAMLQQLFERL